MLTPSPIWQDIAGAYFGQSQHISQDEDYQLNVSNGSNFLPRFSVRLHGVIIAAGCAYSIGAAKGTSEENARLHRRTGQVHTDATPTAEHLRGGY